MTNPKRALAKLLFTASGWLSRIKTWQRWYELDNSDPPRTVVGGRHWYDCNLSIKMMQKSLELDWDHWDHWACIHDWCDPHPCPECGGYRCDDEAAS